MILALVAPALASTLQLGFLPFATSDLPDGSFDEPTASFPLGAGFVIPVRVALRPGAAVRATLLGATLPGHDRVTWTSNALQYESDDHWAMESVGLLSIGVELEASPAATTTPYLGAAAGGGVVATFHSFGGDTALLLDPQQNALDDPQNIDPYTLQAAPNVDVWTGIRIGRHVALDIEAGYTVSFVSAAPLRKSPSELGARRSAYALDLLRLGAGVSVPL